MSDGPHRTLPMRPHWKDLAERAAKQAFAPEEVCEALPHALKRDFLGERRLLDALRSTLGDSDQPALFQEERARDLEGLRRISPGSAVANLLVDCALEEVAAGRSGNDAVLNTVEKALDEHTRASFRSMEEHYRREGTQRSAAYLRDRLDVARQQNDLQPLAAEIVRPGASADRRLPKRDNVDEGPAI